jgi:hypothetical protein
LLGHSIVSQHFAEPEGSIPNSQELSTCPYPEPDQSSPHHPILTNELTPWSWAPLERSIVVWILDSFPAFYATRRLNTEVTRALQPVPILSQINPVLITPLHFYKIQPILSNHLRLGLSSGLCSLGRINIERKIFSKTVGALLQNTWRHILGGSYI